MKCSKTEQQWFCNIALHLMSASCMLVNGTYPHKLECRNREAPNSFQTTLKN